MKKEILILGNPALYEPSLPVSPDECLGGLLGDLHDTLMDFRRIHNAGRAVAAPQVGVRKRVIYMHVDKPVALINPRLTFPDDELMRVLDDCMSFPGLYVYVMRHRRCTISYLDENFQVQEMHLEGGLSELLQHEYDHLDGILATMRAIDNKSFVMK